jgi:hypothetical protein
MTFKLKYRRHGQWFFRTIVATGINLEKDLDRLIVYLPGGGIKEIHKWSECDSLVGVDWLVAKQKDIESKAGQAVPVKV